MIDKAVFAGTFDPMTIGHLQIVERMQAFCRQVVVAVADMTTKNALSLDRRLEIVKASVNGVAVKGFKGLLTDFLRAENCKVLVRGIRSAADLEYEKQLEYIYRNQLKDLEVIYLTGRYDYVSSSIVRALLQAGGDITPYVGTNAKNLIEKYYGERLYAGNGTDSGAGGRA